MPRASWLADRTAIRTSCRSSTRDGRVGIDFGVYGVPETFVIDKAGRHPLQADRPDHRRGAARRRSCRSCANCRNHDALPVSAAVSCAVAARRHAVARRVRGRRARRTPEESRDGTALPGLPEPDARRFARRPRRRSAPRSARRSRSRARATTRSSDYLVARYGDFVLYNPPVKATTWLLWFGPFAALAGGGVAWWMILRRRRAGGEDDLPATTGAPTADDARARALLDERSED